MIIAFGTWNDGLQRISDGNGVAVAISGMLIVFVSLALITLFITILPKIPGVSSETSAATSAGAAAQQPPIANADEDEKLVAIGYALHLQHRSKTGARSS
jgi:Na+-transporting methylmalonyl-CoA/oxaloacetate decarboxylase gamma subunit